MEATALSIAKTMVDSVLKKVVTSAADELAKTLGVRQDIRYIKGELEMMQAFLAAAEARQDDNNVLLIWVRQVRDLAYHIEDCLAEFSLHLENRSLWYKLRTLDTRRRIASNIRDIREEVQDVSQRNLRYNLIKPLNSNSSVTSNYVDVATRMTALVMEDAELVGQKQLKHDLIRTLTERNDQHLKVVWVTGMGGLGKTTLVKNVFDSQTSISCRAWVTLSQTFNLKVLLMEILKQISKDKYEKIIQKEEEIKTVEDLVFIVKSQLQQNTYLVVLDDLWTTQAWDIIENIFPKNNDGGRGRVMVTTRKMDVAQHCNWNLKHIYPVEPLSDKYARELLLRKIYKSNIFPDSHKDLNEVTEKIIKKSGKLPLAIVTIGGLLASKPINKEEWEKLLNRLGSELETNPTAQAVKQILDLSYHDLPYYLKSCFLYLSIFPEDFEIEYSQLVYRWMAEGFIRERRGMTPEEVAGEHFYDLINRNLIQPSKIRVDGTIKSCRVHDIMRELLIAKSIEENLIFVTGEQENVTLGDNIRHLIITSLNEIRGTNLHNVRSVSVFEACLPTHLLSPSNLKLLRVLDLQSLMDDYSASGDKNFKRAIRHLGQFEHLRYISMPRYRTTCVLPKSLGNLRGLQTLDARMLHIKTIPNNITNLQNLRLLRTCRVSNDCTAMPKGIGNLKELQVLQWVDLKRSHRGVFEELKQLPKLRKLDVKRLRREHYKKFSATISELSSLRSLGIWIEESDEAAAGFLDSVSSPPEHLRSIRLAGRIGKLPAWISSQNSLTKVTLGETRLGDDAILVLQELPNLLLLQLWEFSYDGTKLTFWSTTFPKLRKLFISVLPNLEELLFKEGTLPELQKLKIHECELKSGINGAEHLPKLKKLVLGNGVYVANLDVVQRQVGEHPNHPALEVKRPEYQKQWENFYRGTTSAGGPPADEDTEETKNSSSC